MPTARLSLIAALSVVVALSFVPAPGSAERPDIVWMRGGHYFSVTAVAYAPDGSMVASGGDDGTIKLWRIADGMLLRTLVGHQAPPPFYQKKATIQSLAFSPDGTQLASAGNDNAVKVWRLADGAVLATLSATFSGSTACLAPCGVAFSPNGQMLGVAAGGGYDGGLRIWRVLDWATLLDSTAYGGFAFSPDPATPDRVAAAAGSHLKIVRVTDGAVILDIVSPGPNPVPAFSPDGQLILTSGGRVFRGSDGVLVATLGASGLIYGGFGFSPDGQTLALSGMEPDGAGTGTLRSVIKVFRTVDLANPSPAPIASWTPHAGGQAVIAFAPDGLSLASAGGRYALQSNVDFSVRRWRVSDGIPLQTLTAYSGTARQLAVSPDGSTLAAAIEAALAQADPLGMTALRTWDAATGAPVLTVADLGQSSLAFAPDGQSLATTSACCSYTLAARSAADGSLQPVAGGNPIGGRPPIAFSPDVQTVAAYAADGSVQLWSLADGTLAFLSQSPSQGNKILVVSPDGARVAAVADDGKQVRVWDAAARVLVTTLPYGQFITALAFSPDGETLAAGLTPSLSSQTGTSIVRLRVADGAPVGSPLAAHTGQVMALAFSSEGGWLASGGVDNTLRLWSTTDGALLATLDEETGSMPGREPFTGVRSVAFLAADEQIAYSRADATIVVAHNPVVLQTFTLTVSRAGPGGGSVTSAPGGIDCGSGCAAGFREGSAVTLAATPTIGSYFAGWSGDAACASGVVTVTADTVCLATFQQTDLVVSALTAPSSAGPGESITVTDTTTNQGAGPAPASTTRFYLSPDGTIGGTAIALGTRSIPALPAGSGSTASVSLTVPAGTTPGSHFIVARADADGVATEIDETNNELAQPIAVGSDLVIAALTVPPVAGASTAISVSDTTQNQGSAVAVTTTTAFYLSTTVTLGPGAVRLGSRPVGSLAAGASAAGVTPLTIPAGTATGSYFIVAKADDLGAVAETGESNNTTVQPIAIGPDLIVFALTVPATSGATAHITASSTIKNQGGAAGASTTRFHLSTTPSVGGGAVSLGTRTVPALAAGATHTSNTTLTIPAGTATGSYFIVARADDAGVVTEATEANNTAARPIVVGPDLIVSALSAPASAAAGSQITISDTTANPGGGAATASTTRLYLSLTPTLESGAVLLGARSVASIAAGGSRAGSTQVTIAAGTPAGSYFIVGVADGAAVVAETNETNNTANRPLTVP